MTYRPRLVLASASPARRKLLTAAGIRPEVVVSGVDESAVGRARADTLCLTLARMKAEAVADRLRHDGVPDVLVLGCDSVLDFQGRVLGKPADRDQAALRWRQMRGRSGVLHTGHCLIRLGSPAPDGRDPDSSAPDDRGPDGQDPGRDRRAEAVAATTVHFASITDAEIEAYVRTGEPTQVAGAFTIDGLGGPFVESVQGDPGTVIGLSLPLLRRMLAEVGIAITDLWPVD